MTRPTTYPYESQATPAGHAGLTKRLERKRAEAAGRPRFFAPSFGAVPQVADKLKEEAR